MERRRKDKNPARRESASFMPGERGAISGIVSKIKIRRTIRIDKELAAKTINNDTEEPFQKAKAG